jgi:hypothetical protein
VKIQYHTSFPGQDALHLQNTADPSARASFYGVSAAPRVYLDGYSEGSLLANWAATNFSVQSLVSSPVELTITSPAGVSGTLNANVTVRALNPISAEHSVYIAIVEKQVGAEGFVLRKMLPNAAGQKLGKAMTTGETLSFNRSWEVDRASVTDPTRLAIVAFVQADVATQRSGTSASVKEVLQAALLETLPPLSFTTGVENTLLESALAYPNPADHTLHIVLPGAAATEVQVQLIDQLGKSSAAAVIEAGRTSKTLNVRDLAAGLYILQLQSGGVSTRTKVLIAHRN